MKERTMPYSLPTGFIPSPKAAKVYDSGFGWHITLSHETTIHEIAALAYAFNVEVASVNAEGDLVLTPRSPSQPKPAQAEVELAILNHAGPPAAHRAAAATG